MYNRNKSDLTAILLVVCAAASYAAALHVLTVITDPSQNPWWTDRWSVPLAFGVSLGVFFIASFSRWLYFLAVNISFLIMAVTGYFISAKDIIIDKDIIAPVIESSLPESVEFISTGLIITVAAMTVLALCVTMQYIKHYRFNLFGTSVRCALATTIFLAIVLMVPQPLKSSLKVFLPGYLANEGWAYMRDKKELNEKVLKRFDIAMLPSSIDTNTSENLTVILVIGESARADHLSLNGYSRDTNAYTKNDRQLINFANVFSCDSYTRISVPCLLTRTTLRTKDTIGTETSLISLKKKHGFKVTWISMNDIYGEHNLPTSVIANAADRKIFRFGLEESYKKSNDFYLLPHFLKAVQDNPVGRQLIVVHLRGSHSRYSARYPRNFSIYRPDDCKSDTCFTNAYDNSILFTDYMLSKFIDSIREREALLFYVSDHGESLGEVDQQGQVHRYHGRNERIEQRMVPMQVWASELFVSKYPRRFASLKRHSKTPISHDHFFHSVLDCTGIYSVVVDKRLSLCTPELLIERQPSPAEVAGKQPFRLHVAQHHRSH